MAFWARLKGLWRGGGESEEATPAPGDEPSTGDAPDGAGERPAEGALAGLVDPDRRVVRAEVRDAVESLRKAGLELRAVELLGDALRVRPDEIELTAALADVHVGRLDFDSAAPLLGRLLATEEHGMRAEFLLGERAERGGDLDSALHHYERVLARDLSHGQARARAERLRDQLGRRGASAQPTLLQPEGVEAKGRYRLERELGRGGAGAVYVARDTHVDRDVALKVYHPQVMGGDGPKQLAREAALPARVGHPGVVHVFDVDPAIGAVAMEHLDGGSLKDWIRGGGPKSPVEALEMIEAVCRPLAAVHEAGIVHRDMKPANVLRRADGTPVLTDLGVALLPGEEHEPGVGTPAYMAPEQRTERALDARADVYAVGVMLAEMLGGYPGPPGRVGDLLDQCLCESPGGRPQDAAELGRLVRAVLAAERAPEEFAADLARVSELAS